MADSKKRTVRTTAQRLIDAQREIERIKTTAKEQAIDLRKRADGWVERADELKIKAQDAYLSADAKLETVGINAEEFWAEYDERTKTAVGTED